MGLKEEEPRCVLMIIVMMYIEAYLLGVGIFLLFKYSLHGPSIELASMDFTVLNITRTSLSATWDVSIRIPNDISGNYICLQGDLQASFLYKNVTLVTSAPQKYYGLKKYTPQILKVSAVVSGEDISGLVGENIMKDMKEKKEVSFGSQFSLTDCRKKSNGVMRYVCHEANLRFEAGSEMKANLFGKQPTCINV